jgi:hypothetical protein
MMSSHSNPNDYADGRYGMYMQPPTQSFYTSYDGITTDPEAPQMVMNKFDPAYAQVQNAYDNGLLNPNQNTEEILGRNYYTLETAYGETPINPQAVRSCTGELTAPSVPTLAPTMAPTMAPTRPTFAPTRAPTMAPTRPIFAPTRAPTMAPTRPVVRPTFAPTRAPTMAPTFAPTRAPTMAPTFAPTRAPTFAPTRAPTFAPTREVVRPTMAPTRVVTRRA